MTRPTAEAAIDLLLAGSTRGPATVGFIGSR